MSLVMNNPFHLGDGVAVAAKSAPTIYHADGSTTHDFHGIVVEILGDSLVAIKHDQYQHVRDYNIREVHFAF